jgi:hypothetical protein
MRRPSLARQGLPALFITGALIYSYTEQRPQSGVVVRAVADGEPTGGHVRITEPKSRGTVAGGRISLDETVRYRLEPGAYVIRPDRRTGMRARPIRVQVREGRFEPVTVRYRGAARRRGS